MNSISSGSLKPDGALSHFFCPICLSHASDPAILNPCEHVFCRECISEYFGVRPNDCPTCRQNPVYMDNIEAGSLLHRIWSEKATSGSAHTNGCCQRTKKLEKKMDSIKLEYHTLKQDNTSLCNSYNFLKTRCESANQQLTQRDNELQALRDHVARLEEQNKAIEAELKGSHIHGVYKFDRFSVVALTQLLSRYMKDKPKGVDRNKIFDCVRQCNTALEKKYLDNPDNFGLHMQMLFSTCLLSNWFASYQCHLMEKWMSKQGWVTK